MNTWSVVSVLFVDFVIHNGYFFWCCIIPVNNRLLVNVAILINGGGLSSKADIVPGLQDVFADYTCPI